MEILSISHLLSWLRALCLLSLARQSSCLPTSIIGYNSLVDVIDTNMVNTTATSTFGSTNSTNLGAPIPNCANLATYPEWFQPSQKFDNGDCPRALELFFTDYTQDHDGTKYEFLASGVTPVHGIPTQRVPLKAAYGASN